MVDVSAKLPVGRAPRKRRRGLSLIEVIIAMGILVGTTAVLVQLIRVGEKQATRAIDMSEAQTLCHNKMAELMAGLSAFVPIENEPVGIDSLWDYSVKIEPVGLRDLVSLTVIITRRQAEFATTIAAAQQPARSYHLTRWVSTSELPEGAELSFEIPILDDGDGSGTTGNSFGHPRRDLR